MKRSVKFLLGVLLTAIVMLMLAFFGSQMLSSVDVQSLQETHTTFIQDKHKFVVFRIVLYIAIIFFTPKLMKEISVNPRTIQIVLAIWLFFMEFVVIQQPWLRGV